MAVAIVLFAHGARDPEWANPFHRIREYLQQKLPDTQISLAFLEGMQPSLETAVSQLASCGVNHITLVPMFLARGGHLKDDLPKLLAKIQAQHTELTWHVTPAIGEIDTVLLSLANWIFAEHQEGTKE
jgi:sirohydrochlorin cobaltochelatase